MICNLRRAVVALAAGIVGLVGLHGARADDNLLRRSAAAMRAGQVSLARRLANDAVAADPTSGPAHVAAAETALAEGDGPAAEGEISRAQDAGTDPRSVRHLYARARLLQGDANGALVAARQVDAAHWTAGLRLQAQALAATGDADGAAAAWQAVQRRAPDDPGVWRDIAADRAARGDQGGAMAAVAQALTLAPNDLDALLLRARLERIRIGPAAALLAYAEALKRDPNSHAVLVDTAATLGDAGRARDMLAMTRRALAARPGDPQAYYLLAVLAARANDLPLARAMFDRTGDSLRAVPAAMLLGAVLDVRNGDFEQAVARLRNLVGLQPMNIRARQLLAFALVRLDAPGDALEVLRPIALRDDADAYTLLLSARAFERTGDRAEAARLLDRAASAVPGGSTIFAPEDSLPVVAAAAAGRPAGDMATAVPLIRSLIAGGDTAGAVARARSLYAAYPGVPDAAIVLGDTLMTAGQADPAVAAYRRAAELRFDEPTMLRLARALERAGDPAAAGRVVAAFAASNPANVAALRMAARGSMAMGDLRRGMVILTRLNARVGPRDATLLGALAAAHAADGQRAAATRAAAAAYALVPTSADAADLYGGALLRGGQAPAGVQLLQKAVRLAPDRPELHWHLAQAYAGAGRGDDARAEVAVALRDPRFADRAAAQALLAALA